VDKARIARYKGSGQLTKLATTLGKYYKIACTATLQALSKTTSSYPPKQLIYSLLLSLLSLLSKTSITA
jgi:hypothetical protein